MLTVETRKALRTALQVALAICTAIPTIIHTALPDWAIGGQVVIVAGGFSRYFGILEKLPGFPSWLKVASTVPVAALAAPEEGIAEPASHTAP